MQGESQETQLPADADRAWTKLVPVFRKECGVREGEAGVSVCIAGQSHLHPTDVPGELPRQLKMRQPLARRDCASGVALYLVVAAKFEITADRRKPVRNAIAVGYGVPHVLKRGGKVSRQRDCARGLFIALQERDGALNRAKVTLDIQVHGAPCLSCRAVAMCTAASVVCRRHKRYYRKGGVSRCALYAMDARHRLPAEAENPRRAAKRSLSGPLRGSPLW